ncbi:hypothetical protein DFH09DRAFT_1002254 [Mycena vulgaris]|nr:hypothetical protein DFH09DRAFT_1002254 [Mycena vulgaris]
MDSEMPPPHHSRAWDSFFSEKAPDDAYNTIFSSLATRDLLCLMRTCKHLYDLVLHTSFDVSCLLSPFFGNAENVKHFREIQAQTGTLISGSTALQFFERVRWPRSDLDIYAHREFATIPAHFLVGNGYIFNPRPNQNPDLLAQLSKTTKDRLTLSYLGRGISDVFDFSKGDRKVQLIVACSTPMEIILSFHATCVMNVLSHDHAYALYPEATFVYRDALVIVTAGAGQEAGRQKYVDRGWKMLDVAESREFGGGPRWVGDRHTWTIPLRPSAHGPVLLDLCPLNSWRLVYVDTEPGEPRKIRTKCGNADDPSLRYQYTVGDPAVVQDAWKTMQQNGTAAFRDVEFYDAVISLRGLIASLARFVDPKSEYPKAINYLEGID